GSVEPEGYFRIPNKVFQILLEFYDQPYK
ncbi:MAG: hypothetical protein RLZ16_21, partial [Bacteroidota bacterium]